MTKSIEDNQKPPLYVFDSTEKCAGTTLKRYLRSNFQQDNFFDLDNGDPVSEKVRNYGISCPVNFSDYIHLLDHDEINFYEIFSEYLKDRAQWCCTALPNLDIKCVYGNMVHYTTLVDNLKEYYDVKLCKFFREPASRVASEYFYVLNHDGHNLHSVAKESKTPAGYALHPRRPKNRQVASLIGREGGGGMLIHPLKK